MASRVEVPFRPPRGAHVLARRPGQAARSKIDYIIRLHCCNLCLLGACPPGVGGALACTKCLSSRHVRRERCVARRAQRTAGVRHTCTRAYTLHSSPHSLLVALRSSTTKSAQVRLRAFTPRAFARAGARGPVRECARARPRSAGCVVLCPSIVCCVARLERHRARPIFNAAEGAGRERPRGSGACRCHLFSSPWGHALTLAARALPPPLHPPTHPPPQGASVRTGR